IPFMTMVVMMLVLAVVISQPPTVLFTLFMVYAISGPVLTLRHLQQRRAERLAGHKQETTQQQDTDDDEQR
ncbi:MAG: CDP-diacylglycerol--serine O-phosphatidyltransferase, partial [Sedimenticola sp.]|nr:CDP-diacylglycerol--serine O-phosphatidyltransferase [Sedimenticola sp.]